MHILVQPPHEARSGHVLTPATTVSLRSHQSDGEGENAADKVAGCWAFVSVVTEDGSTSLAPPSTTLLSGTLVDSVRETSSHNEDDEEVGRILLENITINQPGEYRLHISLLRMADSSDAEDGISPLPTVMNVGSVLTHVVHVM
ncbi:MAG: hypothetical protein LQ352_004995 [Teloschistes flavicans]|nr:MAG: hypothetical protein LQ352_004995 [Teloschistes flavicans]